jgi:hypothetical protein
MLLYTILKNNVMRKYVSVLLVAMAAVVQVTDGWATAPQKPDEPQPLIIVVLNRANWCAVCKAHETSFKQQIDALPSGTVQWVINDITNDSTIAASVANLKQLKLYKAVYATPRKGMGKMLQSCGLVKVKSKTVAAGMVTAIHPTTHEVLWQQSIAQSPQTLLATIQSTNQ